MSDDRNAAWREERRRAAEHHVAELERRRAAESAQARLLLTDFVRTATERGLEPVKLRARGRRGGRLTFRTDIVGWYLKRDGSLAVDVEGNYYELSTDTGVRGVFSGAQVPAKDPPLAVGVGARDGESMSLADLLQLRLDAGEDFPKAR